MPIIQLAMDRGLGQGDLAQIDVVGLDFEIMQSKLKKKK
jgi:hypothetical protein